MSCTGIVRYSRWAWRLLTVNSQKKPLLSSSSSFAAATFSTTPEHENPGRPGPPPIQVALTESSGRGVFATRKIETGELLHTAKPILSHPSLSTVQRVCYFCLRKLKSTDSSQSQRVSYCSEECQQQSKGFHDIEMRADWSPYEHYCQSNSLKYPLLVKRLACMVMSGAAPANLLDILQPASLSPQMISEMEEEFGLLRNAFKDSNITGEQISFLTKQWYISVLARIRINAFRIELAGALYDDLLSSLAASIEAEAAVGNAVYMLPSFYNHDCDPNAHIIWIENADARLKALRDVDEVEKPIAWGLKADSSEYGVSLCFFYAKMGTPGTRRPSWEELRICYIDASMDHDARQSFLSQGFGFQCNCPRCLSGD